MGDCARQPQPRAELSGGELLGQAQLVNRLKVGGVQLERRRHPALEQGAAHREPFLGLELVKVSEDRTLSLQRWRSPADWWAALEAVKRDAPSGEAEPILVSREFFAGPVVETRGPPV